MFIAYILHFLIHHPKILFTHVIISLIAAYFVYSKMKPFFNSPNCKNYPEFRRSDKLIFLRLFFGFMFLVWPRLILFSITMILMAILLSVGDVHNVNTKPIRDQIWKIGCAIVLFSLGCIIPTEKQDDKKAEAVYKKYLGVDYEISYTKKYASLIANHASWVETFYHQYRFACGFIGKLSASKVPCVKQMGVYNRSIYIDRTDPNSRHAVAEQIAQRQRDKMSDKVTTELVIYPEGTVSNGKFIISFKRGAFMTLLPLKPIVELINQDEEFTLSTGILSVSYHWILVISYLYHTVEYLDLPVIEPTEFMYEKYKNLGKEKWEIYMEVSRRIISECSGLKLSNSTFQAKLDYLSKITGKKIKNT